MSPLDAGRTGNAGTMKGSGGRGLLGWLAANYPETYAQLAKQPREPSRSVDYKDSHEARKRPRNSPRGSA